MLRPYAYNGDGVLVSDGTTTYVQDLAAPLSQVLSDGTATYVYGHERLTAAAGSGQTWYVGDALGSVRQTLDDAGAVLATTNYDPWGTPQDTLSAPFGFTGELHNAGQVYLRARWYAPGQGRFVSEDPFVGFPELPYSLHAYQYAYSNPVRWTDPSGEWVCDGIDPTSTSSYDSWVNPPAGYSDFCKKQKATLDEKFGVGKSLVNSGMAGLLYLFTDESLPGGRNAPQERFRPNYLSRAAERLEFILWYTAGEGRFSHDRVVFSDEDFAADLQDSHLMATPDGKPIVSNQVNHFLTAVDIAYRSGVLTNRLAVSCIVGHELFPQGTSYLAQCYGHPFRNVDLFFQAVDADLEGKYSESNCFLQTIAPWLSEHLDEPMYPGDLRYGNSIQDLRLTLKGWIFGKQIRNEEITSLAEAQTWLTVNLGLP